MIDTNGIHSVAVDFCRCVQVEHRSQLLRIGWWPATPLEPQTCATMAVLRHFHLLNLQGNVTGYSFYRALEYQTDNTGLNPPLVNSSCLSFMFLCSLPPQDHLPAFMLMVRKWRHIKMVKRAGRAFDPGGICCEYTNIFPFFSLLSIVSITFLIYFRSIYLKHTS